MASGTHIGSWTEEDLAGLPEDGQRYELLEGTLLVNPPPAAPHQLMSLAVARALQQGAPAGLVAVEAVGVRLPDDTMFIPDVLVVEREAALANRSGILDPGVVALVVEIVSPGSRAKDRLIKPALYARAGIPCMWRVEMEEGPAVFAYCLEAGAYVEAASARPDAQLVVDQPFPIRLDPGHLRP